MAEYVAYVNVDQIRSGTQHFVTTAFARCGFKRAMRREGGSVPLPTLLFIGESSYAEPQLARHLEKALRLDTLCEIQVLVFQLDKLRSRRAAPPLSSGLYLTPKCLN